MSVFIGYPSFMAYQMMKGKKGNNDGFPSIPGMIARYSASGLTNEQMKENPVWVDKTGNGHDLQMKNFLWGGMSGVGGYVGDFSGWVNNRDTTEIGITKSNSKVIIDVKVSQGSGKNIVYINKSNLGISNNVTIKITSTYPEGVMKFANSALNEYLKLPSNGIITLQDNPEYTSNEMHLHLASADLGQITIEQLPLYPGFILSDGVDDFAVTEKELNFEDTYTVYTAFIPFQSSPTGNNMILCGANSKKTFSMQYSSLVYVSFIAGNNYYISANLVNGLNLFACKRNGNNICIKNLLTNKVVTGTCGDWVENAGLYYLWRNAIYASFARAAIAGQTICNGYFSTDEDDEKVLNWYKKQYPWLFLDHAWSVTGKTNEDEDRATIANIMGNGNNLVLSNFGFAEGSGYGLYGQNYISYAITNSAVYTKNNSSIHVTKSITAGVNFTESARNVTIPSYRIKVTGIQSGQEMIYGGSNNTFLTNIPSDGTYVLPAVENGSNLGFQFVSYTGDCDITIEQIPKYEGYLVTDGVDDEVRSAAFTLNEDWTIVGNWEFITNENKNAGLTKVYSFYLYNRDYGIFVYKYINAGQGFSVEDVKSLKAICSDGRIYLNDWQEIRNNIEQEATISKGVMAMGYFNRDFTKMAFKNLGIYNNQLLSKDDCIKAYNYLQTLKAK